MNSFGQIFKGTSFGESHGEAMGVVIEGCPSGLTVDRELLANNLSRRQPGASFTSARSEQDKFEILSGVFEGKTLGTPIGVVVYNRDARSVDYENQKDRQGHADSIWKKKYNHVMKAGGGRASGRETISRVIVGSFAQMLLKELGFTTSIHVFIQKLGPFEGVYSSDNFVPTPSGFVDPKCNTQVIEYLESLKKEGDSIGAGVGICISNPPMGLGSPVFGKLKSELGRALLGVGAVTGVELGNLDLNLKGTQFHSKDQTYAGVVSGLSTGSDIFLNLKVKPTSSILDVAKQGRHDPCVAIRALPVFESMCYWVLADQLLASRLDNLHYK